MIDARAAASYTAASSAAAADTKYSVRPLLGHKDESERYAEAILVVAMHIFAAGSVLRMLYQFP